MAATTRTQPLAEGLAPHSQEAEQAALGAILVNPEVLDIVQEFLLPEDFYYTRHGDIFESMLRVQRAGLVLDYVTVVDDLLMNAKLEGIGGAPYLLFLTNNTPSAYHAESYARIVERSAVRRRMLVAGMEIMELARDDTMASNHSYIEGMARYERVMRENHSQIMIGAESVATHDAIIADRIARALRGEILGYAIPSRWTRLQAMMPYLYKGELLVLSGGVGSGKSAWIECIAEHLASLGLHVVLLRTEMTHQNTLDRRICRHARVPYDSLRLGTINPGEQMRVASAQARIATWAGNLDYFYLPDPKFNEIKLMMRRYARAGADVIIVDHFHDLSVDTKKKSGGKDDSPNKADAFEEMAKWLNGFAEYRNILTIVCAQLNRQNKVMWTSKLEQKAVTHFTIKNNTKLKSEYSYVLDGVEYLYHEGQRDPLVTLVREKGRFGPDFSTKMILHGAGFDWIDPSQLGKRSSIGEPPSERIYVQDPPADDEEESDVPF